MTPEELKTQVEIKLAEMDSANPKEDLIKQPETQSETLDSEQKDQVKAESKSEDQIELEEAMKMGFDPKFQGPNKKSPKEFIRDGSFFRKIEAQNKKIDDLLHVIKGLDDHTQKLSKANAEKERQGYEKALKELTVKRSEAVQEGDIHKFHAAEAELADLNRNKPLPAPTTGQETLQPSEDMKDWAKENESWFNNKPENKRMVREADGLFTLEKEDNPNLSDIEILKIVKEKIQVLHPERFENLNKSKPVAVTKSSIARSTVSSGLESKLTDRQLNFYKSAKAAGSKMTIQDYAKQLEITGDLKND